MEDYGNTYSNPQTHLCSLRLLQGLFVPGEDHACNRNSRFTAESIPLSRHVNLLPDWLTHPSGFLAKSRGRSAQHIHL